MASLSVSPLNIRLLSLAYFKYMVIEATSFAASLYDKYGFDMKHTLLCVE